MAGVSVDFDAHDFYPRLKRTNARTNARTHERYPRIGGHTDGEPIPLQGDRPSNQVCVRRRTGRGMASAATGALPLRIPRGHPCQPGACILAVEVPLTFDPATDSDPIFSPDGRWVLFFSAREPAGLYLKSSSGAGKETLVAATGGQSYPRDWTSDGRVIAYDQGNIPSTTMWFLPMEGTSAGKPYPFAPGPFYHAQGHFSPDGQWLAYVSNETGRTEVFVHSFPPGRAKSQISSSGGTEPRWRATAVSCTTSRRTAR